ncbi:ribonuclease H-like domain-containing protein [Tanacetum coccineum]
MPFVSVIGKKAILDEYNALITNGTWVLVPHPANVNVVRSMWLFKHKFHADGSLSRYKARLVANGCSQQQGIDCDESFSPVVQPATIRTVLSMLFLSKFAKEILERARMQNCKMCWSVDTESKLGPDGDPDSTLYRSIAGALQYLTFTRADLSYVFQQFCLYMHDPREPHFNALKRILRYVCGTIDYGL